MQEDLQHSGFGKYSDTSASGKLAEAVRDAKRTFQLSDGSKAKTKAGKFARKAATAIPHYWQKGTNYLMNDAKIFSDVAFMKHHYKSSFAQAAMARG